MMLTPLETMFVYMAILVLPMPRCAALITSDTTLKTMPPMIIEKYAEASAWVSSFAPARVMIGSAKATQTTLTMTVMTRVIMSACISTRLAASRSPSPFRCATIAETATLSEMKKASPINFGWVVSPTAAIAASPSPLTMMVSINPTSATRKDSKMEGHAILMVVFKIVRSEGISPAGCVPRSIF